LLDKALHFKGIPLAMPVTFHRAGAAGRLTLDIA